MSNDFVAGVADAPPEVKTAVTLLSQLFPDNDIGLLILGRDGEPGKARFVSNAQPYEVVAALRDLLERMAARGTMQ
jgi:hypothetical protein